ncbi:MAG: hypothetical protein ACRCTJ_02420, partial [Brevinema sp.]
LHSGLGVLIRFVKINYPHIKVAVITNSVMLTLDGVQDDLMMADLVAPSLDAISEDIFHAIDLPMFGINVDFIIQSLRIFAKKYLNQVNKQLCIEIFVVEGLNDTEQEISAFINVLKTISYSKVHLNRLDRIGTKLDLKPVAMNRLYHIQEKFTKAGLKNIEIIGKCKNKEDIKHYQHSIEETITSNLGRRSMSLDDLMVISNRSADEIGHYLDMLSAEKKIVSTIIDGKIVYKIFHIKKTS